MLDFLSSHKEPMSKVDTAWLRMETPHNLMMITGLLFLDQLPDYEQFVRVLERNFLKFRRFRQKAVQSTAGAFWEDDPYFDIKAHVRRIALPGKADYAELQDMVSHLASSPLDKTKPLWQFHLIENYEKGPVVVARIHHCYADGIALIQVLLAMTSSDRHKSLALDPESHEKEKHQKLGMLKQIINPAQKQFNQSLKIIAKASELGLKLIQDPSLLEKGVHEAVEITEELFTALTLSDDPKTLLKQPLGVRKRVAWSHSLDLDEVKALARAAGATVNDVLISSLAGAIRNYLILHGQEPHGIRIRATVPVNLRPLHHARELGNHFGLVFLELPIDEANPLRRLKLVHEEMNRLKSSRQALVSLGLLSVLGMAPEKIQNLLLEQFSQKASAVLTNVPGPQVPLYLAGCGIRKVMFWVPQNGSIGVGLSILSYNNKVEFGLIADKNLIPRPQEVIEYFPREFDALELAILMQPWEGEINETHLEWLEENLHEADQERAHESQ